MNNNNESSKSHFFSNTLINFEKNFYDNSNLEINIEQVSNDTYLKKFKPTSELIDSENLMHNYLNFMDIMMIHLCLFYWKVMKISKESNDRYEYIYPDISYKKEFTNNNLPGKFNLSSDLYQKQFDTNKYTQSLVTGLIYNSPTKFFDKGIVEDFQILFKNPNKINKTGSNNKSNSETKLLSKLMYTLSYPLKKEGMIYDKLLKPTLSVRFSPNNTKNMSNLDRIMKSIILIRLTEFQAMTE